MEKITRIGTTIALTTLLAACGGGGGGSETTTSTSSNGIVKRLDNENLEVLANNQNVTISTCILPCNPESTIYSKTFKPGTSQRTIYTDNWPTNYQVRATLGNQHYRFDSSEL